MTSLKISMICIAKTGCGLVGITSVGTLFIEDPCLAIIDIYHLQMTIHIFRLLFLHSNLPNTLTTTIIFIT